MKRLERAALAVFCLVIVAFASHAIATEGPVEGEYLGPIHYASAIDGVATFLGDEDIARYFVFGFDAPPIAMDVSDPFNPRLVTGYSNLATGDDHAVYFAHEGVNSFIAYDIAVVQYIDAIQPR
ncbi:MAG: hypothetical protein ACI9TH_001068 [Kiritimatiellia bacterium]|jgi:hypothetical protein